VINYTFTIGPLGFFKGRLVRKNFKFGFVAGKSEMSWISGSSTMEIVVWFGRYILAVEKMWRDDA